MSAVKPEFIEQNGKKIFYLNFSHMEKDAIADCQKLRGFLQIHQNIHAKTAVIGLDTIKKMLYEAVLVLSGRGSEKIRVFDGPNAEAKAKD